MSKGSLSLRNPCLRKLFFYFADVMFASLSRSQSIAYEKAPRTCGRLVGKIVGCAQARQVQIQVFDGGFGSDAETLATQHATDWRYICNTAHAAIYTAIKQHVVELASSPHFRPSPFVPAAQRLRQHRHVQALPLSCIPSPQSTRRHPPCRPLMLN